MNVNETKTETSRDPHQARYRGPTQGQCLSLAACWRQDHLAGQVPGQRPLNRPAAGMARELRQPAVRTPRLQLEPLGTVMRIGLIPLAARFSTSRSVLGVSASPPARWGARG